MAVKLGNKISTYHESGLRSGQSKLTLFIKIFTFDNIEQMGSAALSIALFFCEFELLKVGTVPIDQVPQTNVANTMLHFHRPITSLRG